MDIILGKDYQGHFLGGLAGCVPTGFLLLLHPTSDVAQLLLLFTGLYVLPLRFRPSLRIALFTVALLGIVALSFVMMMDILDNDPEGLGHYIVIMSASLAVDCIAISCFFRKRFGLNTFVSGLLLGFLPYLVVPLYFLLSALLLSFLNPDLFFVITPLTAVIATVLLLIDTIREVIEARRMRSADTSAIQQPQEASGSGTAGVPPSPLRGL